MNRLNVTLAAMLLWAGICGSGSTALADGMVSYHIEVDKAETVPVSATAQRAILWYRTSASSGPDGWRIVIQPKFDRLQGQAAWVVPFPEPPTVEEASAELFDAIETLTAPVFIPYCQEEEPSEGFFGCAGDAAKAGGLDGRTAPAQSGVQVWGSGSTAQLDYVVLSAPGGEELIKWLEEQDFRVPDPLRANPKIIEGQYVFAAKLRSDMDPKQPMAPVSFALPNAAYDEIAYPMKLTSLVAPVDGMELILWVVVPNEEAFLVPKELDWLTVPEQTNVSKEKWDEDRTKLKAAFPPAGGLVLEYSSSLGYHPYLDGYLDLPVYYGAGYDPASLGITLPESWPAEVTEWRDGNYRVARWTGNVRADAMKQDLAFGIQEMAGGTPYRSNIHYVELPCSEIPDPEVAEALSGRTGHNGLALLAALCLVLVATARMRRFR